MNVIFDKRCTFLIVGLLLMIVPSSGPGQALPGESPSNIECVERLEIPDYPRLPRQARIQATQTVRVLLSEQGTAERIESSSQGNAVNVDRFFKDGTEKALRNSHYAKSCGGKTITLVFHYELRDDPNRSSLFAFEPPNQFWSRYGPVYVNPAASAK